MASVPLAYVVDQGEENRAHYSYIMHLWMWTFTIVARLGRQQKKCARGLHERKCTRALWSHLDGVHTAILIINIQGYLLLNPLLCLYSLFFSLSLVRFDVNWNDNIKILQIKCRPHVRRRTIGPIFKKKAFSQLSFLLRIFFSDGSIFDRWKR